MSRLIKGLRTGVTINVANVGKNKEGVEDLDEFWDASEVSGGASDNTSSFGRGSSTTTDETFDYDDGSGISEEDEEEESTQEEIVNSPVSSRGSSRSPGSKNLGRSLKARGAQTKSVSRMKIHDLPSSHLDSTFLVFYHSH